jgi:poly [ADP-ribose] polymerase 10/14/15
MALQLQWQDEHSQWNDYTFEINDRIVAACCGEQTQTKICIAGQAYIIDLKQMSQTNIVYKTKRGIRWQHSSADTAESTGGEGQNIGIGLDAQSYPGFWDMTKLSSSKYAVVELNAGSVQYRDTASRFFETAPNNLSIMSISVVQHPTKWMTYNFKKTMVGASLVGKGGASERQVFHGTSHEDVDKIISLGFLRDFNSVSHYGKGTYFAKDAKYSCHQAYSKKNSHGDQVMFLSRIIVGESCLGTKGKLTPDIKPGQQVMFESMVDNLTDPKVFVLGTGTDDHAYPEFLIHFTDRAVHRGCGLPGPAPVVQGNIFGSPAPAPAPALQTNLFGAAAGGSGLFDDYPLGGGDGGGLFGGSVPAPAAPPRAPAPAPKSAGGGGGLFGGDESDDEGACALSFSFS